MRKPLLLLLLLVALPLACRAQQIPQTLVYQLAGAILEQLRPRVEEAARKRADGTYHPVPVAQPGDALLVHLLLLDHPYSLRNVEHLVNAGDQTAERAQLLQYFTPADITYLQQRLPAAKAFRFEQAKIRHPWVKVLAFDTFRALYDSLERQFGYNAKFRLADTLTQYHGSGKTFSISGMLFSKDHKKALATVGYDYGSDIVIYRKTGAIWRQGETLYSVVE